MAIKVGFTYDLKEDHELKPGMPEDALAEFDKEEMIAEVCKAIESGGFEVVRIGHARRLLERLPHPGVDIVFNLCEGLNTRNRESEVPVILDLYGVPCVGSDGLTLGMTLDKAMAKKAFIADGVPTPRYFLADEKTDLSNHEAMKFPFIVKTRYEGSSKGISEESIVMDKKPLKVQVNRVSRSYRQPALVEEFVAGSEFTVLVIGNSRPQALAPVQIEILGKLDLGNLVYTSRRLSNTDIRYLSSQDIKVSSGA
jgi:D-alanine-D-alanine ligase